MGLLQVGVGALNSVLADQWREYFYCSALDADVLVKKGEKRTSKRSFNTKGSDNLISNGSIIAVNEGQCMLIVEQGAIVEVCAQAGEFVFDSSTEPSIFYGNLKENIVKSFKTFGKRFTMGGETAKDQRVYFVNTKEIYGNKYGTTNPVPFRAVEPNINLDRLVSLRCHGEYAYRITDPILFYKNVCGNVEGDYTRDRIDSQLKSELLTALQPAFAKISDMGIRYTSIPGHTMEVSDALNEVLSARWGERYGIEISTFGVSSIRASEEDEKAIKEKQDEASYADPRLAMAFLTKSQGEAMKAAASNEGAGPMMAFAGMNMAANAGGINANNLMAMAQMQNAQQAAPQAAPAQAAAPAAEAGWTCKCGATGNTGKFCVNCGSPKPEDPGSWTCSCGAKNKGKFCMECGKPKPAGAPLYRCDKCGWEPADPTHPPKFCPECGDVFDDNDLK